MDGKHPQNIDSRPKRRKTRDNPYEIFSIGIDTEHPHFYLRFLNTQGKDCMEIQKEVFDLLNRFELEDLSYMNEADNHYEHSELTEASVTVRAATPQLSLEELVSQKIQSENLHAAIAGLPQVQRRRLELYYLEELTCTQIAQLEGCSHQAVMKSVTAAINNLRKRMENEKP